MNERTNERANKLTNEPVVSSGLAAGAGAEVKATCLEVGDRGFAPRSGIQVSKKQNVSSPLTHKDSLL